MVRLVFRPYTQLRRSICTSESLRSSIRLSPDFNLTRHSSPSFGSQHLYSAYSQHCEDDWKWRDCDREASSLTPKCFAFTAPMGLVSPMTCIHVRLLGPCFKTGQSFHRPTRRGKANRNSKGCLLYKSATCLSGLRARTPGADAGAKTSSRAFGPSPTVPVVKPPEDAPADRAGTQRPVIADPTTRAARALRLGPEGKLRGKLRLLPYSFTYS